MTTIARRAAVALPYGAVVGFFGAAPVGGAIYFAINGKHPMPEFGPYALIAGGTLCGIIIVGVLLNNSIGRVLQSSVWGSWFGTIVGILVALPTAGFFALLDFGDVNRYYGILGIVLFGATIGWILGWHSRVSGGTVLASLAGASIATIYVFLVTSLAPTRDTLIDQIRQNPPDVLERPIALLAPLLRPKLGPTFQSWAEATMRLVVFWGIVGAGLGAYIQSTKAEGEDIIKLGPLFWIVGLSFLGLIAPLLIPNTQIDEYQFLVASTAMSYCSAILGAALSVMLRKKSHMERNAGTNAVATAEPLSAPSGMRDSPSTGDCV